jgi:RimJ/RimL family protein N-acetyltransferase
VLNLYNILLRVYSFNKQGIRCYEKAGFRKIGIRKGSKRIEDRRYDTVLMEAVSEDYPSMQLFQIPE